MKKLTKKLTAILIIIIIALSPEFSLMAFADSYTGESTPCNTISYLNSYGYHIGGANANTGATPDYYLQYRTYTASEGSANAKVYNETTPTSVGRVPNSNNLYWYYWDCSVNVSEHGNQYGNYTTDVYRILSDGTSKYYTTATTYVSPIDISYTYSITQSKDVNLSITNTDALGNSIVDMKSALTGNENISYFDNTSNSFTELTQNADGLWTADFASGGSYTLYAKDSAGYEKTISITAFSSGTNTHVGMGQVSTGASATPIVNAYAWSTPDLPGNGLGVAGVCISSCEQISDSTAPDQSSPTYSVNWSTDNQSHSVNQRAGGTDFHAGDEILCCFWVKTTDTSHAYSGEAGGVWTPSWQAVPVSTISTDSNFIPPDGNWHFIYCLYRVNINIASTIIQAMSVGGTGVTSVEINGVHLVKIPVGSNLSDSLQSVKWNYGQQDSNYFDTGNGTTITNNAITVTQNGWVTTWAKNTSGQEQEQTYNVMNYNPYVGDTTPPIGGYNLSTTAWTTGNVTINVTATDAQSGVKSITTPDGTTVAGPTCSYKVSGNGTYNFVLTDNAGNTCTYPVTVSNIDRSVSVSYTSSVAYTVDPDNTGSPTSGGDITLTNNNTHVGAQVTLQSLVSALSGTNGFSLGAQVEESASGTGTWSEIDNKSVQLAGGASTVLGVLSPGGTGHIRLVGQLGSLRWPSAEADNGNMQLLFTADSQ